MADEFRPLLLKSGDRFAPQVCYPALPLAFQPLQHTLRAGTPYLYAYPVLPAVAG